MTETVYIGLGSNMGDRAGHLKSAIEMIDAHPNCRVRVESSLYETEPLGEDSGDWFLNSVICIETDLPPLQLLNLLHEVEVSRGRDRTRRRWAPRTLDLDILFYGDQTLDMPDLVVPHPQLHLRKFVLEPLCGIAPDFMHPVFKRTLSELLEDSDDSLKVVEWSGNGKVGQL